MFFYILNILCCCVQLNTCFFIKQPYFLSNIKYNRNQKYNQQKYNQQYLPKNKNFYEKYIKKLNNKNFTLGNIWRLNNTNSSAFLIIKGRRLSEQERLFDLEDEYEDFEEDNELNTDYDSNPYFNKYIKRYNEDSSPIPTSNRNSLSTNSNANKKSENFEVITNTPFSFNDIGGYDNIKSELYQCLDIITNFTKYQRFNVRAPKGIIFEGPPGNGKTLIARCFAGEANTSFISVSGSQFQEKYVGVGSTRVKELFQLAKKNIPCIIFIDEIDALGRKRSVDGETSTSERDSTLNELLVHLDGFNVCPGIFLIGATNRADLLDHALMRPGRIDKKIYIGPPDASTREAIINIHIKGKPFNQTTVNIPHLVEITSGMSGATIENILNEAMLNALRENREKFEYEDIDIVINRILVGWQPTQHQFTDEIIKRICIHEMGHAIVGFLTTYHSKLNKVSINLSSPTSPGYTLFDIPTSNIHTKEYLFEHLMILLAGKIAEEVFYDCSSTTGAVNDLEEALKLAETMVIYYGMGSEVIYPNSSDKYKELIDDEVLNLIQNAYSMSLEIVKNTKNVIEKCATILQKEKVIKIDKLSEIIHYEYPEILIHRPRVKNTHC